jgi:hypothetical protein
MYRKTVLLVGVFVGVSCFAEGKRVGGNDGLESNILSTLNNSECKPMEKTAL